MWEQFFLDFFNSSAEDIGIVLRASRCRELWLQGELYLAGWRKGLRVNEFPLGAGETADLCCLESPRMVAELKVLGADYAPKTRFWLDSDVERMSAIPDAGLERYIILVIPASESRGVLWKHLSSVCYSPHCIERDYANFRLRLWRLDTVSSAAPGVE